MGDLHVLGLEARTQSAGTQVAVAVPPPATCKESIRASRGSGHEVLGRRGGLSARSVHSCSAVVLTTEVIRNTTAPAEGPEVPRAVADLAAECKEGLLTAEGLCEVALLLGEEPELVLTRTLRCIRCTLHCRGLARLQQTSPVPTGTRDQAQKPGL